MRLSITLDPDLHQIAAARARARGTSLSKEINALLRQATSAVPPSSQSVATTITHKGRRGFPVSHGHLRIDDDAVHRLDDDDDLRHLHPLRPSPTTR